MNNSLLNLNTYQFDNFLLSLRESFHRWGRISSRNEVIEEICKLIFVQIRLNKEENISISSYSSSINAPQDAEKIILKINKKIEFFLPMTVKKNMDIQEFFLNLDGNDYKLLKEILEAFKLIDCLDREDIVLLDLFNEAFGRFLADSFSQEKQLGQYLTPIEVVRFIVSAAIKNISDEKLELLIDPVNCENFGYILDPSCGVGSFLVEFIHQLLPTVISKHGKEASRIWLRNMSKILVGFDKSQRMLKLAIAHFSSLGLDCSHLYNLNSLDIKLINNTLDFKLKNNVQLILTNPPFGAEFFGNDIVNFNLYKAWSIKKPKKIDSELLFMESYSNWLKSDGECFTIIPESVLTNKGVYQDLRLGLSNLIDIKMIISLPRETFSAAGTSAKTSIFNFTLKNNLKSNFKTKLALCENIGFKVITKGSQKNKVFTKANDLEIIKVGLYEGKNGLIKEISFNNNDLRWDAAHYFYEENITKNYLSLTDVALVINERCDPKKLKDVFDYVEISDIDSYSSIAFSKVLKSSDAPSRARKIIRSGDVLASTVRPEQKKFGVLININTELAICSTGIAVIRPLSIEPFLLTELLKSDFVTKQLLRHNIGVSYPTVDESCFLDLKLPIEKEQLSFLNKKAEKLIFSYRCLEQQKMELRNIIIKSLV